MEIKAESIVAQLLQNVMLSIHSPDLGGRAARYILRQIRRVILRVYDPAIVYDLLGTKLLLPFSHQLPYILQWAPEYTLNVARVARHVAHKYPDMSIIDIGANVGDTLAIIRSATDSAVLCIEGENRFYTLLERNARLFKDVELAHAFIGGDGIEKRFAVSSDAGTAHLSATESADGVPMLSLAAILTRHPGFRTTCRLIKIDTDGFDVPIVLSSLDLLTERYPVVFFEYSPFHLDQLQMDGLPVFPRLRDAGYVRAIVWENGGEFLLSAELEDHNLFEDLHYFYSGRRGTKYCDVAVFGEHDRDLCETVRRTEIALFQNMRGTP